MCLCIPLTSCFYVNQTKEADKILECDFPVTIRNRLKEFNKINQVNLYKFNNPLVKLATNEFFICIKYPKYNSCKNYLIKKPFTNTSTHNKLSIRCYRILFSCIIIDDYILRVL